MYCIFMMYIALLSYTSVKRPMQHVNHFFKLLLCLFRMMQKREYHNTVSSSYTSNTQHMSHASFTVWACLFSATPQQAKKGSSVYADGIEQSLPRPSLCHRLSSVSTADDALSE